jgi:hypothetical protein
MDDSLPHLIDRLLHDPSVMLRRKTADALMRGHHARRVEITSAFARVLAEDSDRGMRHRAATYLSQAS